MSATPWWWDADQLRAALETHGSCSAVSKAAGGTPAAPTLNYWARKLGIELTRKPGQSYQPGVGNESPPEAPGPESRMAALSNDDLARLVEALGPERAAAAVGANRTTFAAVLRDRGVTVAKAARSPRVAALERRIAELEQGAAGTEELAEAIREAAEAVEVTAPPVTVRKAGRGPLQPDTVDVVFHVSDMQYGERVHGSEVPGGRYDPAVFREERLPAWRDHALQVIEQTATAYKLGTVWFAQGGDYVEGDGVFRGQEWHLAMDAGTQVATLAPVWALEGMAPVAKAAKRLGARAVAAVNVVGNHGVHGGRGAGAVPPALSYDYLTYELARWVLRTLPDGGGFDWYQEEAARAFYFVAQGHTFLLTHGDQDRGGGLIGVAAVTGLRNDLMVRRQARVDHRYHLKGHYHKPTTITPGAYDRVLWNGAWIGANNLSVGRGGASYPEQAAYVVHPTWGARPWPMPLMPVTDVESAVHPLDGASLTA